MPREGARHRRSPLHRARGAEKEFAATLRRIARHIGDLARSFDGDDPAAMARLETLLRRYSVTLKPWAHATAARMVAEVDRRDAKGWAELSREVSAGLRREIRDAPTGQAMRDRLAETTKLITSLPVEAAERVRRLTTENLITGARRAADIAAEIARTGEVSRGRANLIARTEVARTAAVLTQVRAEFIGSPGYHWLTAGDGDVRPSHRRMGGRFVLWSDAPTLDGMRGHAGEFPGCRCTSVPVLPED